MLPLQDISRVRSYRVSSQGTLPRITESLSRKFGIQLGTRRFILALILLVCFLFLFINHFLIGRSKNRLRKPKSEGIASLEQDVLIPQTQSDNKWSSHETAHHTDFESSHPEAKVQDSDTDDDLFSAFLTSDDLYRLLKRRRSWTGDEEERLVRKFREAMTKLKESNSDLFSMYEEKIGKEMQSTVKTTNAQKSVEKEKASKDDSRGSLLQDQDTRANQVREAFAHAWSGYSRYAWGHDEIKPVSNEPYDSWGSFGATIVDSLDTLYLMGMDEEFERAKDFVSRIQFKQDVSVSFFETSIRYLGGLLGAYNLSGDAIFLHKAKELADRMLPAFDSPSGIPYNKVNLVTGEVSNPGWTESKSILSEVGSVQLEWKYLSHHTGNPIYWNKVEKPMQILQKANKTEEGMYPLLIDEKTGKFYGSKISWGGLGDSFYEYLLKQFLLTNKTEPMYKKMYEESVEAMKKFLVLKSRTGDVFVAERNFGSNRNDFEHLACFIPGMLLLGADEIPERKVDLELARELLKTCVSLYTKNPSGLPADHVHFNVEYGSNSFDIVSAKYILRPETLESLYYMYMYTGEEIWREYAWTIFQSIEKHCKTESSYSGIVDTSVDIKDLKKNDAMETFFLAETLKYLYLIFKPNRLDLRKVVISTEAHILTRFDKD